MQNSLIEALQKGVEGGYLEPAYFQPNWTPLVFQHDLSATPPIDDPTVNVVPSPQAVPGSSSDSQPIQSQSGDSKAKDHAVTMPVQSNIQD
jgi:hypothetical protein